MLLREMLSAALGTMALMEGNKCHLDQGQSLYINAACCLIRWNDMYQTIVQIELKQIMKLFKIHLKLFHSMAEVPNRYSYDL
jgi:hypothetical protein